MIKTLSREEFENYYGYEDEPRKDKGKRSNIYEPYIEEIRIMLEEGHTVADIHRVINQQHGFNRCVETLRDLVHWKLKDAMPKGRRWANRYGVCNETRRDSTRHDTTRPDTTRQDATGHDTTSGHL